jgi:hypothetical protein
MKVQAIAAKHRIGTVTRGRRSSVFLMWPSLSGPVVLLLEIVERKLVVKDDI